MSSMLWKYVHDPTNVTPAQFNIVKKLAYKAVPIAIVDRQ